VECGCSNSLVLGLLALTPFLSLFPSSCRVAGAAAFSLLLLGVLACLATQQRTARVSLSSPDEATTTNWWTRQLSNTAAQVFWPHHKLISKHARESQGLVLLNPGELSGGVFMCMCV